MYIFPFLVEGGAEGICTCTEEHKIKYEYHVEKKQISPFLLGDENEQIQDPDEVWQPQKK
jgi:hypothetical protein